MNTNGTTHFRKNKNKNKNVNKIHGMKIADLLIYSVYYTPFAHHFPRSYMTFEKTSAKMRVFSLAQFNQNILYLNVCFCIVLKRWKTWCLYRDSRGKRQNHELSEIPLKVNKRVKWDEHQDENSTKELEKNQNWLNKYKTMMAIFH